MFFPLPAPTEADGGPEKATGDDSAEEKRRGDTHCGRFLKGPLTFFLMCMSYYDMMVSGDSSSATGEAHVR